MKFLWQLAGLAAPLAREVKPQMKASRARGTKDAPLVQTEQSLGGRKDPKLWMKTHYSLASSFSSLWALKKKKKVRDVLTKISWLNSSSCSCSTSGRDISHARRRAGLQPLHQVHHRPLPCSQGIPTTHTHTDGSSISWEQLEYNY